MRLFESQRDFSCQPNGKGRRDGPLFSQKFFEGSALNVFFYQVDEPFVGLDPISMGVIVRLVRRMNDALGITSIVVSHDVAEVSTVADCSFLISDGKVAASGSPGELQGASSELVRQFMHGMADGPVAFHFDAPDYAEQLLGRDSE